MKRFADHGHSVGYFSRISSRRWLRDLWRGRVHHSAPGENPGWRNRPWTPLANRIPTLFDFDEAIAARGLNRWIDAQQEKPILWLEHPHCFGLVDRLPHARLVYDVMDLHSAFSMARADLRAKEDALLARADVVFTGGRAMHERTVERRPDSHCFPSGIDLDHFGKARDEATSIPAPLRDIPHPILGYFGAVDERLDFQLLESVCRERPNWTVVLIGPLIPGTKIAADAPNFHWLGPQPYAALPGCVRAFDVCIMPWAKTELTAHISPTKTPEYLAGGKPVVSTRIRDVERDYGDVVLFGDTPEEFIAASEHALADRDRNWAASLESREAARTWEQIAEAMMAIIQSPR
jgi:UDP-galactopyranose mutase